MKRNTRQRLLDLVVARIGAVEAARRLEVARAILDTWLSGSAAVPDDKLVLLVDVIDQTGDC